MRNFDFTFEPLQRVWSFKRRHLRPQFFHHLDAHHIDCIDCQIDTSFVHDATSVKRVASPMPSSSIDMFLLNMLMLDSADDIII